MGIGKRRINPECIVELDRSLAELPFRGVLLPALKVLLLPNIRIERARGQKDDGKDNWNAYVTHRISPCLFIFHLFDEHFLLSIRAAFTLNVD